MRRPAGCVVSIDSVKLLKPAPASSGCAVSVALTDERKHTAEPRLGELQRAAGFLFVIEPHDLKLGSAQIVRLQRAGDSGRFSQL